MPSGKKRTNEEFLNEFNRKNTNSSSIKILGQYLNNNTNIACLCLKCGNKWNPTPKTLLSNHGCPKCGNNQKFTKLEFLNQFHKNNSHSENINVIGEYGGVSKKIKCECKICKNIWYTRAGDLIYSNSGCPICSGSITQTHNIFLKKVAFKNIHFNDIEFKSQYTGSLNRIKCQCKICGHEWEPIASSLLQGTGCPKCAQIKTSQKGKEILKKVRDNNPAVKKMSHKDFIEKLYLKNPYANSIEIINEYKGANTRLRCKCKRCNNIWEPMASALLQGQFCPRCQHSSTSFMEQFIAQGLIYVLGKKHVIQRDKKLINKELDIYIPKYQLAIEPGSWKWHKNILQKDIEKINLCKQKGVKLIILYDSCPEDNIKNENIICFKNDLGSEKNHKTLKQFLKSIFTQNNIIVSEDMTMWSNIEQRAYKLSQRITNQEFIEKFKINNNHYANIIIKSQYTRAIDSIECECKNCGNIWKTPAYELLKGKGCPKCQIKQVGLKKQKRNIIKEWRRQNPYGNKLQCEKETGISRVTIYKWWND